MFDLQNQLKTKETEINLSSQVKKLNQELDEMMENDEELKILHENKLLSSTESQGKSSELNKLLVITEKDLQQKESKTNSVENMIKEKEYQFDELSQMIDASLKQLDWINIRRASEVNQTRWKLSPPSLPHVMLKEILKEKT
ncbi:hypothetical protein TNIN_112071 [Trichonephila inaurata madagascariensis]|uniref:Uncharacterized protein n=1 Tax=Trichonephila inaurata madagascariensis TaxID=2747483 RepID=A0A8X7CFR1_9ARAC|nr:hypothetical protein TNIN_112071 [Trichonephila inaurata madagascariensis]